MKKDLVWVSSLALASACAVDVGTDGASAPLRVCEATECTGASAEAAYDCADGTRSEATGRCVEGEAPGCYWETIGCGDEGGSSSEGGDTGGGGEGDGGGSGEGGDTGGEGDGGGSSEGGDTGGEGDGGGSSEGGDTGGGEGDGGGSSEGGDGGGSGEGGDDGSGAGG